ncbi:protein beta [Photobacterium damselae]
MFNDYKYIPILSLKPAEMVALDELNNLDKDLLLPLIPLKRWTTSRTLEKSIARIEKAFNSRKYILDIDKEFVISLKNVEKTEDIHNEIKDLYCSDYGYKNWYNFLSKKNNIIPCIQFDDINVLEEEIHNLLELKRPLVARFEMSGNTPISPTDFNIAIRTLSKFEYQQDLLIILDYGDLDRIDLIEYEKYSTLIRKIKNFIPSATFSISGTSFPYSFSGSFRGEIPIYERQIFNKIIKYSDDLNIIYSDRGSTRALNLSGGSGLPPPRIDYPLKNDWRFIRKEFSEEREDKEELYTKAAKEMMNTDYWNSEIRVWGTQMIEKTAIGDKFGITSANRATAVRINLHLHQQLHYFSNLSDIETEEDWED